MHYDISPKECEGRATAVWVQQIVPCGALLISVCFYTGEGPSPRNTAIMSRALQVAGNSGVPWVIGGDFQDTPQEIAQWAGEAIDRAQGRIIHGDEPTVYPSVGVPRVIDFFILSEVLCGMVDAVGVDERIAASPHRAVSLS